jgi:hypothetical protein
VTVGGLRTALVATLGAGAVAALVALVVGGGPALKGVGLGLGLLLGFYLFGLLTMQLAASVAPALALLLALLTYTLQVVLLGLAFVVLQRSGVLDDAVDREWFGGTVIVGTLVWTTALVVGATRQRIPLYHTGGDLAKPREPDTAE